MFNRGHGNKHWLIKDDGGARLVHRHVLTKGRNDYARCRTVRPNMYRLEAWGGLLVAKAPRSACGWGRVTMQTLRAGITAHLPNPH